MAVFIHKRSLAETLLLLKKNFTRSILKITAKSLIAVVKGPANRVHTNLVRGAHQKLEGHQVPSAVS